MNLQLTLKEAELKKALEEKEIAKSDLAKASENPDHLLAEAREARDAAVSKKGELELQLARVRIDLLQVNSQLMEAVQQKVELSQQIEQWQVRETWSVARGLEKEAGEEELTLPREFVEPIRERFGNLRVTSAVLSLSPRLRRSATPPVSSLPVAAASAESSRTDSRGHSPPPPPINEADDEGGHSPLFSVFLPVVLSRAWFDACREFGPGLLRMRTAEDSGCQSAVADNFLLFRWTCSACWTNR